MTQHKPLFFSSAATKATRIALREVSEDYVRDHGKAEAMAIYRELVEHKPRFQAIEAQVSQACDTLIKSSESASSCAITADEVKKTTYDYYVAACEQAERMHTYNAEAIFGSLLNSNLTGTMRMPALPPEQLSALYAYNQFQEQCEELWQVAVSNHVQGATPARQEAYAHVEQSMEDVVGFYWHSHGGKGALIATMNEVSDKIDALLAQYDVPLIERTISARLVKADKLGDVVELARPVLEKCHINIPENALQSHAMRVYLQELTAALMHGLGNTGLFQTKPKGAIYLEKHRDAVAETLGGDTVRQIFEVAFQESILENITKHAQERAR